ncbi:hypothetical protein [Botrimarina hoheduenensis]|uniref:Uncharacterized protein n=1 Tax=Botrimarina hoheduenensis TaxID=2528000 RepID=A0A5C5WBC5_9BACT|nr:hypothetical protein [Botrimarina hoheduenensis]TWT47311.1 hypothetical protein Pla111_09240 [Botrimarina hoheduenensis]
MRPIAPTATVFFLATLTVATTAQAWNPFASKASEPPAEPVSLQLTQQSGPWLIVATTFSGEGAEQQARELCAELRQTLQTNAYVHQMTFDFTKGDERIGRGVDQYGQPVKMRYRSGQTRREWAVLVGDYPAVDDSLAEDHLDTIKHLAPESLETPNNGESAQNYAQIRRMQQLVLQQRGKRVDEGPMRTAFLTRNPLLPEEYFVPQGVDEFVSKLNKGIDHSLLESSGRYTVRVATFRGRGTLLGATNARSSRAQKKRDKDDPLMEAGWNAHMLCLAMREAGWEAYEFHDRTESYVSVGSFDTVMNGDQPIPEVMKIVRTFGAQHPGPTTPLDNGREGSIKSQKAEVVRAQFNQMFSSEVGQVANGLNPKYANIDFEPGKPPRPVTFDVRPLVVEAPRRNLSSRLAWRR